MTIGDRIRLARFNAGLSASALANKIKVYPSNIMNWETGRNEPRINNIMEICRATNVTPNWLTGWDTETHDATMAEITSHLMAAMAVVNDMKKRKEEAS